MANAFSRKLSQGVGTTLTAVGSYTVGASTQTTVIGLVISNVLSTSVEVDALVHDGTNSTYIIKSAPILPGAALVIIGGDQKVVLLTSDSIKVKSNTASSIDVVMSILEIT